jgi:Polyketide cyclase / dehydrase and lipid transport
MNTITYTLNVNASCETVFELIEDESKARLWMEGVEQMLFNENEKRVGAHFVQHVREGRHVHAYSGEIIEYEPPHKYGLRLGNSAFTMEIRYTLDPNAEGCAILYESTMVESNWLVNMMSRLFSVFTRRLLHRHMQNLKQLAEDDTTSPSPAWS